MPPPCLVRRADIQSRRRTRHREQECGFASTAEGNLLTVEDQIAKLRLVVEAAREVSREVSG
jgi:hypothetical protein